MNSLFSNVVYIQNNPSSLVNIHHHPLERIPVQTLTFFYTYYTAQDIAYLERLVYQAWMSK